MTKKVGVDMGGTWLRVGIVETDGQITRFMKHPRPAHWEGLVSVLTHCDEKDIEGFGVAISGPIANHASVIKGPNIPWLEGRNVREDLQTALGKRVVVSNDMEAATEGEIAHGVLRRFTWAVFETISTGWGGNLILNGLRVDSEPGHANVTFDSHSVAAAATSAVARLSIPAPAWSSESVSTSVAAM